MKIQFFSKKIVAWSPESPFLPDSPLEFQIPWHKLSNHFEKESDQKRFYSLSTLCYFKQRSDCLENLLAGQVSKNTLIKICKFGVQDAPLLFLLEESSDTSNIIIKQNPDFLGLFEKNSPCWQQAASFVSNSRKHQIYINNHLSQIFYKFIKILSSQAESISISDLKTALDVAQIQLEAHTKNELESKKENPSKKSSIPTTDFIKDFVTKCAELIGFISCIINLKECIDLYNKKEWDDRYLFEALRATLEAQHSAQLARLTAQDAEKDNALESLRSQNEYELDELRRQIAEKDAALQSAEVAQETALESSRAQQSAELRKLHAEKHDALESLRSQNEFKLDELLRQIAEKDAALRAVVKDQETALARSRTQHYAELQELHTELTEKKAALEILTAQQSAVLKSSPSQGAELSLLKKQKSSKETYQVYLRLKQWYKYSLDVKKTKEDKQSTRSRIGSLDYERELVRVNNLVRSKIFLNELDHSSLTLHDPRVAAIRKYHLVVDDLDSLESSCKLPTKSDLVTIIHTMQIIHQDFLNKVSKDCFLESKSEIKAQIKALEYLKNHFDGNEFDEIGRKICKLRASICSSEIGFLIPLDDLKERRLIDMLQDRVGFYSYFFEKIEELFFIKAPLTATENSSNVDEKSKLMPNTFTKILGS